MYEYKKDEIAQLIFKIEKGNDKKIINYFISTIIFTLFCFEPDFWFCEIQYKRTEQSFKISFVNAEWCNIQNCINCKSLLMMCKISAKCPTLDYIEI
ncbi:hypothetical protein BpHYR1_024015 [Brachionus plicatilis]|uniref:Uncharacterized protein n=1 Tax=Brachionus plicatilis TaxID=10195 RepID=A0A3M7SIN1_BRAPC|nr:hypothetical protein BpHYR1_024015 [Brachionus plicatilis]